MWLKGACARDFEDKAKHNYKNKGSIDFTEQRKKAELILRKVTPEELRANRCSAYEYLIP